VTVPDDARAPGALADPAGFYGGLREQAPVHWSEASGAWLVTSHAEVTAGFKDDRLSSDRLAPMEARLSEPQRSAMAPTFALLRAWMVFQDGDAHLRLREPVRRVFTPRRVAALAPRVGAIVADLLDELAERGEADLLPHFAFPLPAIVIAELLGVPADDRDRFKLWSRKLAGLVFGATERAASHQAAGEATAEFSEYFGQLIRLREKQPADDLISALVAARDRDALTPEQVVGACTMLLFGGHETTTTLIANAVMTLLEYPDELARLRDDAALDASAIEELLRFDGPASIMVRLAREAHERGGQRLETGDRVYLAIAGANHDPAVFAEPGRLDLARAPNPHLGFGLGRHFCLGAALARLESRLAVTALIRRFPGLEPAGEPQRAASLIGRGYAAAPLAYRP